MNRPNRQLRRRFGKTDATDAQAAARAVLSGQATGGIRACQIVCVRVWVHGFLSG